ncbi:MAG: MerR family transcriptional regulator [Gammaproteobacteria bacterium]|nr:MerR family transcriptional regulator [Gammaproteobacteria bacterium]
MSEGVPAVTLKMKDLEARTGVSREAIHFYLREGLLPEPTRPKRNVAHYSEEHVVRIKVIKRLQEERFLPLGVIKTMFNDADFGSVSTLDNLAAFEMVFVSLLNGDAPTADRSLSEVAAQSGLAEAELTELAELGVIEVNRAGKAPTLNYRDTAIIEQWARLRALGFAQESGYDAGFLKRYADTMKQLADAEVDMFLEVFGNTGTGEAAELATRGIEIANDILTRLHTRALAQRLSEHVENLAN